jgi:hypothetical protein
MQPFDGHHPVSGKNTKALLRGDLFDVVMIG